MSVKNRILFVGDPGWGEILIDCQSEWNLLSGKHNYCVVII